MYSCYIRKGNTFRFAPLLYIKSNHLSISQISFLFSFTHFRDPNEHLPNTSVGRHTSPHSQIAFKEF